MINQQTIAEWIKEKKASEIVAVFAFIITIASFLVRGFWFLYQWGFYSVLGVHRSYIDVDSMGSVYYVLSYMGLSSLFIISNYFVYSFWINMKWKAIVVFLLVENALFWWVIFVSTNIRFDVVINEIRERNLYIECLSLEKDILIIIITLNLYGICFGMIRNWKQKKGLVDEKLSRKENGTGFGINYIAAFVIIVIVEGLVIFYLGINAGYKKADYKVIVENIVADSSNKLDDKYVFETENNEMRIYPILYENNENYVISNLYWDDGSICIESTHQKVISKEGVETIYYENIFEFNQDKENEDIDNIENEKKEMEKEYKMLETLAGVVVGAILTFLIGLYQDRKADRNHKSHAASLLYYDLKSIEDYLKSERSSVNLRYSGKWQDMVSNCLFLRDNEIAYLYKIYDELYNYNYHYRLKEETGYEVRKEDILQYGKLKELFFDKSKGYCDLNTSSTEYIDMLEELKKYIKK